MLTILKSYRDLSGSNEIKSCVGDRLSCIDKTEPCVLMVGVSQHLKVLPHLLASDYGIACPVATTFVRLNQLLQSKRFSFLEFFDGVLKPNPKLPVNLTVG